MVFYRFLICVVGPRINRIFKNRENAGRVYSANLLESSADNVISFIYLTWSVAKYTTPIILAFMYQKGYPIASYSDFSFSSTLIKSVGAASLALISAFILRGWGRYSNEEYRRFIDVYNKANNSQPLTREDKLNMAMYDFDFRKWPVEYKYNGDPANPPRLLPQTSRRTTGLDRIMKLPCDVISYIVVILVGRRMLYPGSVYILQKALEPMLLQGRTRLIERNGGERFKLQTQELNEIDVLFVNNRGRPNGQTLVICCEGNGGFYEIGTMVTPIEAGYSVLGWNTPGFAGSTGLPYPIQVVNAFDTVIHFAIEKLGFKFEQIIVFAWSIGGFPATWAAMSYENIKGLVLDATFDDVLPLALSKMPQSWKFLVTNTIRNHFNLNNEAQLKYYNGPVLLIRRTKDEIICTDDNRPISSNRANNLVTKLLKSRFPRLLEEMDTTQALCDYLAGDSRHQERLMLSYNVNEESCVNLLASYVELNGSNYPLQLGEDWTEQQKTQFVLYLTSKHMLDYNSTHCTPLPRELFKEPWDIKEISNRRSPNKL